MGEEPAGFARGYLEDDLVAMLTSAEIATTDSRFPAGLQLGVPIVAGRSKPKRPPNYVAVIANYEEPRLVQGGLWMVDAAIWCVTQTDGANAVELSKALVRKMGVWLGPACPARRVRLQHIFIHAINLGTATSAQRDYQYADVIPFRAAVRVFAR